MNADGTPAAIGKVAIDSHIKSVVDLYKQQKALRINNEEHPRVGALNAFLGTLDHTELKRKRETFDDRGTNTLDDGYLISQLDITSRYFMK